MSTRATAQPNIALVKYWGKQDKPGNLPATPNLSITLDTLQTTTTIDWHTADEIVLNGQVTDDVKISNFLRLLRNQFDIPPLRIESANNFPTGAGLASSASGFAALVTAINQHAELQLDAELMSMLARQGSASAARSMYGGFVALVPPDWRAQPVAGLDHWPLKVVVAITSNEQKSVSSTVGMERTRQTSPFYNAWLRTSADDFTVVNEAVASRDFARLGSTAEHSCLKMHALMLTSQPALIYWNSATLACMSKIQELRAAQVQVFFTIDAGPQIKAVCLPEAAAEVAAALAEIPGVLQTITCGLGAGARLL